MIPRLFQPDGDAPRGHHADPTVGAVVAEYLRFRAGEHARGLIGAGSLYAARLYCTSFAVSFGDLPVSHARRGDLRRWLNERTEYQSAHTLHGACGAVVACFRWAAEDGLIDACPYSKPKDLPVPQPRAPIMREEVRRMLDHARHGGYAKTCERFRMALWFLWQTGARPCEMYRLDWDYYDPIRGCFELAGKTTRATGRSRLIALPSGAWRLIRLMRRNKSAGPVFVSGRGTRWTRSTFGKLFRRHARLAGVRDEVSAYSLRHGFCVELLELGAGERQIADAMGHTTTRLIGWYGRAAKSKVDYLRETMDRRK